VQGLASITQSARQVLRSASSTTLVMAPPGQELDPLVQHSVHDPMLVRQSPRPQVRAAVLQGLWLADSPKRIQLNLADQLNET
jgi:hypothetical protein